MNGFKIILVPSFRYYSYLLIILYYERFYSIKLVKKTNLNGLWKTINKNYVNITAVNRRYHKI